MAAQETRRRAVKGPVTRDAAVRARSGRGRRTPGAPVLPSVANHPRAGAHVDRAKAWGGLAGFALVAFVSWRGGVPVPDVVLRALAGGIVAYLVTWACAVAVWRHLVLAELRLVRAQRADALAEAGAAAAEPESTGAAAPGAR